MDVGRAHSTDGHRLTEEDTWSKNMGAGSISQAPRCASCLSCMVTHVVSLPPASIPRELTQTSQTATGSPLSKL